MYYYSNKIGVVLFASHDSAMNAHSTALVRVTKRDGSGIWTIVYTDENGDRQNVGEFFNPWVARRTAVSMGMWQ